ncbi:CAP domain-containing protein [Nanoarchaeota archaeon]
MKKKPKQKSSIWKKIKKIILWGAGSVVGLFVLLIIWAIMISDNLCFLDEDGNNMDGEIFYKDESIGETTDGCLSISRDEYGIGEIGFLTEHNEREVYVPFEVTEEDIEKGEMEFTVSEEDLLSFRMLFFIEGTNTRLNGDVYLNNKKLGKTTNGVLTADVNELFPGKITLKWEYNEQPYNTYFELKDDDFSYSGKDFHITKESMGYVKFDASKLDNNKIETNVAKYINTRRKNAGLEELKYSSKIADSARDYAKQVADPNFKPSDKKAALDKLSEDGIFTFYADGISYAEQLTSIQDEDYLVEQIMGLWFNDAWVKDKLLEEYSDIGIGIHLSDKVVVAIGFVSLSDYSVDGSMESKMCSGVVPLYNKNLPYDKDIKVNFKLDSSAGISAYIVTDEDAQQDCIRRNSIDSIKEYRSVKEIDEQITLPKGASLLLKTSDHDADYTYSIEYVSS